MSRAPEQSQAKARRLVYKLNIQRFSTLTRSIHIEQRYTQASPTVVLFIICSKNETEQMKVVQSTQFTILYVHLTKFVFFAGFVIIGHAYSEAKLPAENPQLVPVQLLFLQLQ